VFFGDSFAFGRNEREFGFGSGTTALFWGRRTVVGLAKIGFF